MSADSAFIDLAQSAWCYLVDGSVISGRVAVVNELGIGLIEVGVTGIDAHPVDTTHLIPWGSVARIEQHHHHPAPPSDYDSPGFAAGHN